MATGKKGKKPKAKTFNLQEFLSDTSTGGASVAQVTKNISWSDECYDFDEYAAPPKIVSVLLPTAPRSTRVLDDSTIPQNPPFLAYMSNLPYDLTELDLQEFFELELECEVVSVRLPREDGDSGRMRGFGYVEFKEREQLIAAVSLPDPQLRNRKIRIDVSTEQDQKRAGGRGRYDNFGASSEIRDTNWRRGDGATTRQPDDSEYGARRSGFGHNRERPREEEGSADGGGNWRSGDRPRNESPPPPREPVRRDREPRERGDVRDRDSGRDRYGGGGSGGGIRRNNGYEERPRRDEPPTEERPRLKLQPRTVPLPEFKPQSEDDDEAKPEVEGKDPPPPRPKPVPSATIFGAAKPVDTAAKDRAIEERMERIRLEKQKEEEEKAKLEHEQKELEKEQKELEKEQKKDDEETANGVDADDDAERDVEKSEPVAAPVIVEKKEAFNWRRKSDDPEELSRTQSPPRRRSPDRRRRISDDRRGPRDHHHDNRDRRDFPNNRDKRDYRDNNRNDRDSKGDQYNRDRNYNRGDKIERPPPNRDSQNRDRDQRGPPPNRDDRDNRPPRRRDDKDENIENRMPKLEPDTKPKLQTHNPYGVFDQEASD